MVYNNAVARVPLPVPKLEYRCSSNMGTPYLTPHPHIASELGMGVPIMPGSLGIPVGPKALGIWGPHSDMGTPHT